ncbi:MAG: Periplasmic dipeptide transport protein precursor [Chloroflexi bacterium ADurb.Bin325]|nr:MAG: Periplasmic dipeptide transport protein precursor [Chloroflexi bacterium ADurb.Bin325]
MKRWWPVLSLLVVLTMLLGACATPAPGAPQVVKETVVVEKEVVQTQIVEKIVEREVEVESDVTPAPEQLSGTFIVGRGGDSVILDIGPATDGESWRVSQEVNEPLVRLEGTSTKPIPWLAESWETEDSQTWIFHLRQGVKFHNGNPFNAEVVAWNIDRWKNPDNEYRFGRAFEYYDSEFGEETGIESVEVLDDYTVKITLMQPSAVMLAKLSLTGVFGMVDPQEVMAQGDKYGTAAGTIVGTGPFKFVEWVPDDHITLERNDDWWGGPPRLARIIFRSIPDNSARFAELQAGTVHQADLAQTDLPAAAADPNLTIYQTPPLSTGYIAFQQCIEPFDKLEVRQAVAHAVDWAALIEPFYGDYGEAAQSFQPPAILGHNPNIKQYEYDPEKAKELLAAAGLPDGFETDFWYLPVIRGYFPDSKPTAEAIAADLAKVGIKVNLQTEDWGAYLDDRNNGKFPMWMLGWGSDNGDPDNYLGWHFYHPIGEPKAEDCYANDKVAELIIQGRVEPDLAKREAIYQEAEQLIHDDAARISVVWVPGTVVMRNEVKGYLPVVFRSWYENLWLAK